MRFIPAAETLSTCLSCGDQVHTATSKYGKPYLCNIAADGTTARNDFHTSKCFDCKSFVCKQIACPCKQPAKPAAKRACVACKPPCYKDYSPCCADHEADHTCAPVVASPIYAHANTVQSLNSVDSEGADAAEQLIADNRELLVSSLNGLLDKTADPRIDIDCVKCGKQLRIFPDSAPICIACDTPAQKLKYAVSGKQELKDAMDRANQRASTPTNANFGLYVCTANGDHSARREIKPGKAQKCAKCDAVMKFCGKA